jgi:excisionase family DNA binding protein
MSNQIIYTIPLDELLDLIVERIKPAIKSEFASINLTKQQSQTEYLTRKEVASHLKIGLKTLNEWTKSGRIQGHRIGRRVLFKPGEVEKAVKAIRI